MLAIACAPGVCPTTGWERFFDGLFTPVGLPLDRGLTYAVYGAVGLFLLAFGFNVARNVHRRARLMPARVHRSTRLMVLAVKLTAWAKALTIGAVLLESFVQAAQFTMVLEEFFQLPETPGALFWQNRLFIGFFAGLLVLGFVRRRRLGLLAARAAAAGDSKAGDPGGDEPEDPMARPHYDAL